ncbi:MAG: hypothetical protein S4CHLAM81_11100 [Chlamydiales bacterium]|nr:hypothetical protein [Chlamydiales bacterium]MCH9635888.1 hypothetical protein [Chlamydiales bacterium]MCH9703334.1 hypothetical protein [Chlamydiota bacterium]
MRYLFILCLLMSPLFAKDVHVKQGWTIIFPDATVTIPKGVEVSGMESRAVVGDTKIVDGGELRVTVNTPGGSTVTVPDGYYLEAKRGRILLIKRER